VSPGPHLESKCIIFFMWFKNNIIHIELNIYRYMYAMAYQILICMKWHKIVLVLDDIRNPNEFIFFMCLGTYLHTIELKIYLCSKLSIRF